MSSKLSAITPSVPIGKDVLYRNDNSTGTPASASSYLSDSAAIGSGAGYITNGYISVAVASNNITVSLLASDGTAPSATNPVNVKIGTSVRRVTSSLSVTVNAGTNSFNAGAAEFAAKAVQYFVYLGYRSASAAVVIGFSRIPYARLYSDFSATATNEKYAAFSTAPASSDDCVNVARFNATLSAAASYNWSVPTFTSSNLIQNPIYETVWLTWSPTFTNLTVGNGTLTGYYKISYDTAIYKWTLVFGSTTSISGSVTHTLPFSRSGLTDIRPIGFVRLNDASATVIQGLSSFVSSTSAVIQQLTASGTYLTGGALSSTVPFTWTTSDEIMVDVLPYNIK